MTDVLDRVTDVQTRLLDNLESVQERVISTQEKVADAVTPRLPDMKVPFADRMPSASEVVSNYFDFVAKANKMNRTFAQKVVDAWTQDKSGSKAKSTTGSKTKKS